MEIHYIIANIFSLLSSICTAVSVVKKSKKDLIKWQTYNIVFYIFACIVLHAYTALISVLISLVRNILSYKDCLTKNISVILCLLIIVMGLLANNQGIIGFFPILAIVSYTVLMYTTKNEQQMRYALILNMILWFFYNLYILAYPSALTNVLIFLWTLIQIIKNQKKKELQNFS